MDRKAKKAIKEKPIYIRESEDRLMDKFGTTVAIQEKEGKGKIAINNFPLEFADVDNDPNTYNSSRAYIDLNGAKEIAWAGLFWSASRYKGNFVLVHAIIIDDFCKTNHIF